MAAGHSPDKKTAGRHHLPASDALLPVGKVAKAHGIRGEVKIYPFSGDPSAFPAYPAVALVDPGGRRLGTLRVSSGRLQGRHAILRLAGIESREQAESLVGCEVLVDKAQLPPLAEDEFYWQEMAGRRVVTIDGRELGRVSGLLATGAHDVLVVTGHGREYLIPAVREFMSENEKEPGTLVVAPVPGLLEMND